MPSVEDFYAVIPAGGAGTRLWPLSRASRPKFLIDLLGTGQTLLQSTVSRLQPLTGSHRVLVVTGVAHRDEVMAQVPEVANSDIGRVLTEPAPRDSMAAIGLAAAVIAHRHGPDVVMGSFAADHVINGQEAFQNTVREAIEAARAGYVVTVGISPTGPSTAFGYIAAAESLGVDGSPSARHVTGFTEKPDALTAASYLETGRYSWNAGMFVVRVGVLLDHLRTQLPILHDGLRVIAAAWDTPDCETVLGNVWPGLTRISIDHAIAEPVAASGGVAVVPGAFEWDDVGDFESLASLSGAAGRGTLGDDDQVLRIDSEESFVVAGGRRVTVIGIPRAVVVDTPDAILVTTRDHAQQVKEAVDGWRNRHAEAVL